MDLTQVNRSTLVFVISVMFWGWVLRPLGMLLAVIHHDAQGGVGRLQRVSLDRRCDLIGANENSERDPPIGKSVTHSSGIPERDDGLGKSFMSAPLALEFE